jgi:putative transposon-encoded protein
MLVNEHYQEALRAKVPESEIDDISERNAEISFNSRIKDFRASAKVPCVKVSTDDDYPGLSSCFSTSSLKISSNMQRLSH